MDKIDGEEGEQGKFRNILNSKDSSEVYHIGIIDYLQKWDLSKKSEAFFKSKILGKDKNLISAVPPEKYEKRFREFMCQKVFFDRDVNKNYRYLFNKKQLKRDRTRSSKAISETLSQFLRGSSTISIRESKFSVRDRQDTGNTKTNWPDYFENEFNDP